MSRVLAEKWVITGELVAQTTLAVGGMGGSGPIDLALAQDGQGRPFVPGSSLAGPLRRWVELNQGYEVAQAVFGFESDRAESGHASWVTVKDAQIDEATVPVVRPGIQIDRDTGATRTGYFFQREVWPRGTRIPLEIQLDVPQSGVASQGGGTVAPSAFSKALLSVTGALAGGGLRFGGGKTRGGGRLKLENAAVQKYDFMSGQPGLPGLFAWLRRDSAPVQVPLPTPTRASSSLALDVVWRPAGAVMTKAAAEADNVLSARTEPLGNGDVGFVLPGSGLKGVLRQRSALILRTVLGQAPNVDAKSANPDGDLPLLMDLYGSSAVAGRVLVEDVYQNGPRARPPNGMGNSELKVNTDLRHHVAIDRFTGGVSGSALFSTKPPAASTEWTPFRIEMDLARQKFAADEKGEVLHDLSESDAQAELALLLLTLRDFVQGWVPVGFATRRGMGAVSVRDISIVSPGGLPMGFDLAAWCKGTAGLPAELSAAWNSLVQAGGRLTVATLSTRGAAK
jgi:CRISPR/Cas system CSM-associated protein Csm3 (group 7 of RAMP superfamily)